jgi:cytoskeletal protein CcmA (bactofilin family)
MQPPAAPTFSTAPAAARTNARDSKISAGLKIHGEISGSSDLYIDGEAQGKIRFALAQVTVGPNGRVQADIEAREIVVLGTVRGNLKASERIHLGESSRVQGSLQTPRLGIEDGAKLRGKVDMTRAGEARNESAVEKSVEKADAEALKPVAVQADEE